LCRMLRFKERMNSQLRRCSSRAGGNDIHDNRGLCSVVMVLIYTQPSVADNGWIMVMVTPECVI
jgi:hypothetical protein